MTTKTARECRRHPRISLPTGMMAAWYGGGDSQVSRVKTLSLGGALLEVSRVRPIGTTINVVFQVPGGVVQAEGVVRSIWPDEGMGIEFTNLGPNGRELLEQLLERLLR